MKIIEDLEQGSDEWLSLRRGKITASCLNEIVTPTMKITSRYKSYASELAAEIIQNDFDLEFISADMERGIELEEDARLHYEEATLSCVKRIGFFDCGDFGASPDGLVGDEGLIEIKCPKSKTHIQYIVDDCVPSCYANQCQGLLLASGRKFVDFVSYNKNFNRKIFVKRIFRDEERLAVIKEGIIKTILYRNHILKSFFDEKKHLNLNLPGERND